MYQLRDYQLKGKQLLYQKIREGKKKVIYWAPTGCGKGLCMSDITADGIKAGKRVLTILRRRELIFQTGENYRKYHKHEASLVMGSEKGYLHWSFTQICSIDTIRKRMKEDSDQARYLQSFDIIIIDECHDTNSDTYQEFFKWIDPDDKKNFIGFTATPFSLGGKPLLFWEDIICPLSPAEARDRGFLVQDITYIPEAQINLANLDISRGDYKEADLFERAADNKLIGDIVDNWIKNGQDRPTLVFAVNKDHSKMLNAAFISRGIRSYHIDDSTPSADRKSALERSKSGQIQVICSVGVLTTGVDTPWISCIILARATDSLVLYIQIVGRGLRPFKICATCGNHYGGDPFCFKCKSNIKSFEKEGCIIFDHGSNVIRHGTVYEDRKAKLAHKDYKAEGKNGEASNVRITTCASCFAVYSPSLPCCPQCATVNAVKTVVKSESGELKLIDESTMRKLQLNRCLSALHDLEMRAQWYSWKPAAVWFKLHKQCGDVIFNFQKELNLPWWLKDKIGVHEVKNEG
jgi:DNA repair protein RadD